MATAEELLSTTSQSSAVLVADLDTRIISIPASIKILGVESDDDVKHLTFNVPQYYGDIDLSEFKIQVNFENARGRGDFYPIETVEISDEVMSFVWEVDRSAFEYKGDVEFNLCMKKYDDDGVVIKELNFTPATLPVLKGLETSKEVVENNPSAFDAVLFRLYAVEAATGNGQNGHYSIVKVTESDDGILFTIANSDGTTAALVKHGKDAVTPIKGVDYFTEEEKTELKTEITKQAKQYIDAWAPVSTTVTLLSTGWTDNKQTVIVDSVDVDSVIVVSPEPSDDNYANYTDGEIRCVAQETSSLTFQCGSTPSTDILVNVAIYYSNAQVAGAGEIVVADDGDGNVTIV